MFTIEIFNNSVYLLSDDTSLTIDDAIEFLADNYDNHGTCELVEENEQSVADFHSYESCVVFHDSSI